MSWRPARVDDPSPYRRHVLLGGSRRASIPPSFWPPCPRKCPACSWSPGAATCAAWPSIALQRAVYGERSRLFSATGEESQQMADQLFDAMSRRGFQLFLDRFSGTAGRLFPQEIAEELAERDVVVVIETPNILQSRSANWEVAVRAEVSAGRPALHGRARQRFRASRTAEWSRRRRTANLRRPILPRRRISSSGSTLASLTRTAFYETLIDQAAKAKGGRTEPLAEGTWAIRDVNGTRVAGSRTPPAGAARRRRVAGARFPPDSQVPAHSRLQHRHLPAGAQTDMALAGVSSETSSCSAMSTPMRASRRSCEGASDEQATDRRFRSSDRSRICRRRGDGGVRRGSTRFDRRRGFFSAATPSAALDICL